MLFGQSGWQWVQSQDHSNCLPSPSVPYCVRKGCLVTLHVQFQNFLVFSCMCSRLGSRPKSGVKAKHYVPDQHNNHRWLPCCACFKYWASLHISARIEHLTQSHGLQLIFTAEIRCDQRTSTETVTVCICVFYWSVSGSVSCTELGTSLRSLMGTGVSVSGFVRLRHWPRDLSRFANAKKRNEVPVFTALFLTFIHVQDCENCV